MPVYEALLVSLDKKRSSLILAALIEACISNLSKILAIAENTFVTGGASLVDIFI